MIKFYVYMLRCADDSFYIGQSSDLEKRLVEHNDAHFDHSFTSSRRPLKLVYSCEFKTRTSAIMAEKQIKKWSRRKKEDLIVGKLHL